MNNQPHPSASNVTLCRQVSHINFLFLLTVFLPTLLLLGSYASAQTQLPTGFSQTNVATGLSLPTSIALAPDGRLFICEKGGALRVVKNGVLLATPFLTVDVDTYAERGLDGIALDPDFAATQYVYVYYTARTPTIHNRLSRFTAYGDVAVPGSEQVLLDLPTLNAGGHNGGALNFGPDGKLYISTGENGVPSNSQTLSSPLGKILRINSDGTIPPTNPFYGIATGINQAIWALGLRNPFTFSFQPGTGRMFINDVGNTLWEEINEGVAGANYGWPTFEGYSSDPNFRSPVYSYAHIDAVVGAAITGGAFYNPTSNQFPAQYLGKYLYSDLANNWIRVLDPATGTDSPFATSTLNGPAYLTVAPDGSIYYLSVYAGCVSKITYSGSLSPQIGTPPQNQLVSVGYPATFSVTAYGAPTLSYQWERMSAGASSFTPIAGATSTSYTVASPTLADNQAQFRCVVSNSLQPNAVSAAATLTVTTNLPPTVSITSPGAATTYRAGDTINFSGIGTDSRDGTLPASNLIWEVRFHHNTHWHPVLAPFGGATGGSFAIPTTGEVSNNVWYRIILSGTNSTGLTDTKYVDLLPLTSTVTLASNPTGMQIMLDGNPVTTPYSFVGVAGMTREIAVYPQVLNGVTYALSSWSDGGAATHNISTPAANTTLTAAMSQVTSFVDGATYIQQNTIPAVMTPGVTYSVSIAMKNTGTTTWAADGSYRIAAQNSIWGTNAVTLTSSIAPGEVAVFNFTVTGPATPGSYQFQWQMFGGSGSFGDISNLPVTVTDPPNAASFVSWNAPATMFVGQYYPFSIVMKNTGLNTWGATGTWTSGSQFRLGSQAPQDNTTWGTSRVSVPTDTAPGQNAVFNFLGRAPLTPGNYGFKWKMVQDGVDWFGGSVSGEHSTLYQTVSVTETPTDWASFLFQSVATTMATEQSYDVYIKMLNTGSSTWPVTGTWTSGGQYRLGSLNPSDNQNWGGNRAILSSPTVPGGTAKIAFKVRAPSKPGTYNFQWQMVNDGVAWFGVPTPNVPVTVTTPPNGASFYYQSVPATMTAGQQYNVYLKMKNTGTNVWPATSNSWTSGSQYRLGAFSSVWGGDRVALTSDVAPGQIAYIPFVVTAPLTPGVYNFQWQLVQDDVEWFGDISPATTVNVISSGNAAVCTSPPSVPTTMTRGQVYNVSVTLKNTGTNSWPVTGAWTSGGQYRLGSQNPQDSTVWGGNRVALVSAVPSGATMTLNFTVRAPTTPGTYNFQWKMVQDGLEWFGDVTPNVSVTVN